MFATQAALGALDRERRTVRALGRLTHVSATLDRLRALLVAQTPTPTMIKMQFDAFALPQRDLG